MLNASIQNQGTTSRLESAPSMIVDHAALRLSASLMVVGVILAMMAGIFHPGQEPANHHIAAFTEYAHNDSWTIIHLGQFVGTAVMITGLLVLFFTLDVHAGIAGWARRFGGISALVALALYGVLQAVDGVALKQAVDAWLRAPETEKAARFASAETVRWLEWAVRSYHSFMLGLAFVLFALVIVSTARLPKPIGYLMGVSGLAYITQGWVLGFEGFSATNTVPTLLGILVPMWSIWLLIVAWRTRAPLETPTK
jgi:hypothetical protein